MIITRPALSGSINPASGVPGAGLKFNFIGDNLVGSNNAAITAWADSSPAADNLGTFAGTPTKKTNIINGHAVGRCPGDSAATFASSIAITGNFTYMGVVSFADLSGQKTLICGPSGSLDVRTNSAKLNILKCATANIGSGSTTLSTGTFYTLGVTYDGTNAAFYLNGSADGTASSAQTFTANVTQIWINPANLGEQMNGDIAQQLLWNTVLSGADLTTEFAALRATYGHY